MDNNEYRDYKIERLFDVDKKPVEKEFILRAWKVKEEFMPKIWSKNQYIQNLPKNTLIIQIDKYNIYVIRDVESPNTQYSSSLLENILRNDPDKVKEIEFGRTIKVPYICRS